MADPDKKGPNGTAVFMFALPDAMRKIPTRPPAIKEMSNKIKVPEAANSNPKGAINLTSPKPIPLPWVISHNNPSSPIPIIEPKMEDLSETLLKLEMLIVCK